MSVLVESVFRLSSADQVEAVRRAFEGRPRLVDKVGGFRRMEVYSSRGEPLEFRLMTYWDSEADFRRWFKSHQFQDSHEWIPAGVGLDPGSAEVRVYDFLCD